MNSIHISSETVRPIKTEYLLDPHFDLNNQHFKSIEGIEMYLNNLHFYEEDSTVNNYSNLMMTSRRRLDDFSEIKLSTASAFPQKFTSFLIFGFWQYSTKYQPGEVPPDWIEEKDDETGSITKSEFPLYLTIEEAADETRDTRNYTLSTSKGSDYTELYVNNKAKLPNNTLFEIELIDEQYCRISHNDTYLKTYLTYPDVTNRTNVLQFSAGPVVASTDPVHSQIFGYSFSREQGRMVLTKTLENPSIKDKHKITYITFNATTGELRGTNTSELAEDFGSNSGWSPQTMISVRTFPYPENTITIENNWVRYAPDIQHVVGVNTRINQQTIKVVTNNANSLDLDLQRWNPAEKLLGTEAWNRKGSAQYMPSLTDCTTCIAKEASTKLVKCYNNLDSNYIVNSEYATLSGLSGLSLGVNFTPTKNYLNPDGTQSLGNALETFKDVDMRDYFKIFSGTNQIRGDQDISLGYQGYNTTVTLKKDTLTYFHMPEDMTPYKWVNINWRRAETFPGPTENPWWRDLVGLLDGGAIAGQSPVTSDKIFKRRGDYRENTSWGQSHDEMGNWLCTWLGSSPGESGSPYIDDINIGPVWYDRYYDTSKLTYAEALTSKTANCYDTYAGLIDGVDKFGVGDVQSQLRLEPGVLYAYHHIGPKENNNIISSFDSALVHKDLFSYTQVSDSVETELTPDIDEDDVHTYSFSGDSYAKTITPKNYIGDLALSFWMHQSDWTKPIGHQIVGNYLNGGVGIFNDECVTPLLYIVDTDGIKVTNTDLLTLNTILSSKYVSASTDDTFFAGGAPMDDFTILKSGTTGQDNTASRFDIKGLLTEKRPLSADGGNSIILTNKITDITSNSKYIYTLLSGLPNIGRVKHSQIFTDLSSESWTEWSPSDSDPSQLVVSLSPNQSPTYTKIEVDRDGVPYRLDADDSDMSVENTVYYLNNNVVYMYNKSLSASEYTGTGMPVVSGGWTTINQVKTDLYGNVWILHEDCISKYNRENILIKTIDIQSDTGIYLESTAPIITGAKCFDFVAEYTGTDYRHYAIVLNKNSSPSLTGVDVVKIDVDSSDVIGYANVDININKELDTIKNLTNFKVIKNSYNMQSPGVNIEEIKRSRRTSRFNPITADPVTYDTSFDDAENTLTFKVKLRNRFDADDVQWKQKKFDVTSLSPGYHHIGISFDSWKCRLYMYVDGLCINPSTGALTDQSHWGKYSFTDTINRVMTVGASPFFNNNILCDYLQQPGYYFANSCKIKDFRLYDTVIADSHIKALARAHHSIEDLVWTVPSGSRQYLDIVDKVFKHRLPGRKSEVYDVSFINSTITDTTLQNTLTSSVMETLSAVTPVYTVPRSFRWSADSIDLTTCKTSNDSYDGSY